MRPCTSVFGFLAMTCLVVGCGSDGGDEPAEQTPLFAPGAPGAGAPSAPAPAATPDVAATSHPEVVQLEMPGRGDGLTWFCTGTLVSSTLAVTAAHCLQPDLFESWEVIAPGVKGRPRAQATPAMYDALFDDPAHPDLGVLVLTTPITLPRYAELAAVGAQIDAGQTLEIQTLVRTKELPEAPLALTTTLPMTSTVEYGYMFGYGVPQYSHGGDSGVGLFLLENGQMTHTVVAVERQPDPDRGIDHLSRIDDAFIAWVADPARAAATPPPPVVPGGGHNKKK
jgi:hypothetical protein